MMDAEFKQLLQKSKEAIASLEEKVESYSKELPEEVNEFWADLKTNFNKIKDDLLDDEVKEKAQEKALIAKEKLSHLKESATEVVQKVKDEHAQDLDLSALKAHLAKMDAEDFIEESKKKISRELQESTHSLEKLALNATKEIKEFFEDLTNKIEDKKS